MKYPERRSYSVVLAIKCFYVDHYRRNLFRDINKIE